MVSIIIINRNDLLPILTENQLLVSARNVLGHTGSKEPKMRQEVEWNSREDETRERLGQKRDSLNSVIQEITCECRTLPCLHKHTGLTQHLSTKTNVRGYAPNTAKLKKKRHDYFFYKAHVQLIVARLTTNHFIFQRLL